MHTIAKFICVVILAYVYSRFYQLFFTVVFDEDEDGLPAAFAPTPPPEGPVVAPSIPIIWMAPFFAGGGYCSEAISFALSLHAVPGVTLKIVHHGDSFNPKFVQGLGKDGQTLTGLAQTPVPLSAPAIVVCHSEPGAWYPPKYSTSDCPPGPPHYSRHRLKIGRTMFETDRLPDGWAKRLNRMDYVWVPTQFHLDVFEHGGVIRDKLVVMPEAVDTEFYNPNVEPMKYPGIEGETDAVFKFLSIFKWEERKGWKFLLQAFLSEFTREDKVALYILTNAYHTDNDFQSRIDEFVSSTLNISAEAAKLLPPVRLLPDGIPTSQMPSLYKGADAFVIPSRGEGWGRPHCEAMSMGLPVIATHWSGPEEFMNELNSFPLHIDGLEDMHNENFPGHNWAIPSVTHLRQLMRLIVVDPTEAKKRGARARRDMETKYCPSCIAELVLREIARYPMPQSL